MGTSTDSPFLERAAELAERGRLRVEPNPVVGCVLVKWGQIVGEGWHARFGEAHAERAAIQDAGEHARDSIAYVTLEPCDHEGKTPPCSQGLIDAGVKEVVYAHADPNPKTAGQGPARLKKAGIKVRKARASKRIKEQLAPYLAHLDKKRPWVIAKWAMTLDGKIATRTGDSKWITGDKTRAWTHSELRASVDAIVVGAGTVRADDPNLLNRSGKGGQPLRVIVCGKRALPKTADVLTGAPSLIVAPDGFRPPGGAEVVFCGKNGKVDPRRTLRALHKRGLRRILLEGGSTLLGSFLEKDLVDQAIVFIAPKLVGGANAPGPIGGRGVAAMGDALPLSNAVHRQIGADLMVEGLVHRCAEGQATRSP
ncbi:MAG: bifunctional diaminohydroxyphosphoribosylaminopyrimidine deaminase/5-amino-6-(5-phosphoribosylamino)uracil reductase RibD [Planctomycetota bacterium]